MCSKRVRCKARIARKAQHTLRDSVEVGLSLGSGLRLGVGLSGLVRPNLGGGLRRCQSVLDDLCLIESLRRYPYPSCGEDLGGGDVLGYVDGF
jgi:hypothetical protein